MSNDTQKQDNAPAPQPVPEIPFNEGLMVGTIEEGSNNVPPGYQILNG
jgi:hypothetical protein